MGTQYIGYLANNLFYHQLRASGMMLSKCRKFYSCLCLPSCTSFVTNIELYRSMKFLVKLKLCMRHGYKPDVPTFQRKSFS